MERSVTTVLAEIAGQMEEFRLELQREAMLIGKLAHTAWWLIVVVGMFCAMAIGTFYRMTGRLEGVPNWIRVLYGNIP